MRSAPPFIVVLQYMHVAFIAETSLKCLASGPYTFFLPMVAVRHRCDHQCDRNSSLAERDECVLARRLPPRSASGPGECGGSFADDVRPLSSIGTENSMRQRRRCDARDGGERARARGVSEPR